MPIIPLDTRLYGFVAISREVVYINPMRFRLAPSDLLSLSFLALLGVLTVFSARLNPAWPRLLATYATLAAVVIGTAVYRSRARSAKRGFALSVCVTVVTILSIFNSLGDLIAGLHVRTYDDVLIAIDHALFGVHPTVWLERLISPLLTAVLQFSYISYYFIPISLGVTLIAKGRYEDFEEALFGIVLCFYLSYIGYLLVPAIGPRFTLDHLQTANLQDTPIIKNIQDTLNGLEKNKTDAFPSGHTAVALMSLYYGWKKQEKKLIAGLLPVVSALIFSTVYLRYHYVIDVIAGFALTALTIYVAPPLFRALSRATDKMKDGGIA